jgi:DNA-binding MarR family transcriptional regulator
MSREWQPGLFFEHPMARTTDHDSSHVAADAMEATGTAQAQRHRVLELVRHWPGITSSNLARLGAVDRHMVARRLPELRREGWVTATKPAGREILWWPAPQSSSG